MTEYDHWPPIRFRFAGDVEQAKGRIPQARTLMSQLIRRMEGQERDAGQWQGQLSDGTQFRVAKMGDVHVADIFGVAPVQMPPTVSAVDYGPRDDGMPLTEGVAIPEIPEVPHVNPREILMRPHGERFKDGGGNYLYIGAYVIQTSDTVVENSVQPEGDFDVTEDGLMIWKKETIYHDPPAPTVVEKTRTPFKGEQVAYPYLVLYEPGWNNANTTSTIISNLHCEGLSSEYDIPSSAWWKGGWLPVTFQSDAFENIVRKQYAAPLYEQVYSYSVSHIYDDGSEFEYFPNYSGTASLYYGACDVIAQTTNGTFTSSTLVYVPREEYRQCKAYLCIDPEKESYQQDEFNDSSYDIKTGSYSATYYWSYVNTFTSGSEKYTYRKGNYVNLITTEREYTFNGVYLLGQGPMREINILNPEGETPEETIEYKENLYFSDAKKGTILDGLYELRVSQLYAIPNGDDTEYTGPFSIVVYIQINKDNPPLKYTVTTDDAFPVDYLSNYDRNIYADRFAAEKWLNDRLQYDTQAWHQGCWLIDIKQGTVIHETDPANLDRPWFTQ